MTLQQGWDKTETANVVTSIFGYNENSSETDGHVRNSAIPVFLDEWFHGDNRQEPWPNGRTNSLGTKSLEEYSDLFPNYRIKTAVEIGFDTDGQTISSYEVQMATPSELSPITLEGGQNEPANPFRNQFDHYDGDKEFHKANKKGPLTTQKVVTVNNDTGDTFEGVRGSIIFGGNDPYLVKLKADAVPLDDVTSKDVPRAVNRYYDEIPSFYAFLDFVFMADGAKLARVWDVSRYPGHALYVGGQYRDERPFRDGTEWRRDGIGQAFAAFATEGLIPGFTPFGDPGAFGYEDSFQLGFGDHPVMDYGIGGSNLTVEKVENTLSEPLFPPNP